MSRSFNENDVFYANIHHYYISKLVQGVQNAEMQSALDKFNRNEAKLITSLPNDPEVQDYYKNNADIIIENGIYQIFMQHNDLKSALLSKTFKEEAIFLEGDVIYRLEDDNICWPAKQTAYELFNKIIHKITSAGPVDVLLPKHITDATSEIISAMTASMQTLLKEIESLKRPSFNNPHRGRGRGGTADMLKNSKKTLSMGDFINKK